MSNVFRICSIILLLLVIGFVKSFGAGYEKYRPAECIDREVNISRTCGWWSTLKKEFYVDDYAMIIDKAAFAVKDVLGQFGILANRRDTHK